MRANLPVRGLRCSFPQVLQTETNKSLAVEMTSRNTKTGGTVRKAGFGLAGFLALWGVVAVVTGRKDRTKT